MEYGFAVFVSLFWRATAINDRTRVNQQIRISPVRVIDPEGEQVGIVPIERALELAEELGLDLVEVAPMARPPVCRIMDYGKFKYEEKKKEQASRRKQHQVQIKELRVRPGTGVGPCRSGALAGTGQLEFLFCVLLAAGLMLS